MAEDAADDRAGSGVLLSLRPLRLLPDPTTRGVVAAALTGAGGRGHGASADVLRLAGDAAGPWRLSAQPVVDVDAHGRLAIPGWMAARPPATGRTRAHPGHRAGRRHACERDARAPRSRV